VTRHPRIETVVARTVGDVGDAGEHSAVEADAGGLNSEMVEAADGIGWFDPRGGYIHYNTYLLLSMTLRYWGEPIFLSKIAP